MTAEPLKTGLVGRASIVVGPEHLADRVGSGTASVFSTPMMVALMEQAAVDCVEARLGAAQMSLGIKLAIEHIAATPPGARVQASARLIAIDGRTLTFEVEARDDKEVIGRGQHTRAVVDRTRFLAKLAGKSH